MNIVYTTNDNFVPQVSACMVSVFENNKDVEDINIYIVSFKICEDYKSKLKALADEYTRKLFIIDFDDIRSMFSFDVDTLGWHITVLARLFFDEILPLDVEKIIYLDGDTVCLGSLQELWDTDMSNNVIAGSLAPTKRTNAIVNLGYTENDPYINAGVLLINLKKWREENTGKRIIKFYQEHEGKLYANDQDAINGTLKSEIKVISPKFNYYTSYIYYPYKNLKRFQHPYKFISKEVYDDAKKDPRIIHYLGEERPWRKGCKHPFQKQFDYYTSLTPWKGQPKETGWELYFKCFYIFNFFAKKIPSLRVLVIDNLAPFFMKMRKRKLVKQGD